MVMAIAGCVNIAQPAQNFPVARFGPRNLPGSKERLASFLDECDESGRYVFAQYGRLDMKFVLVKRQGTIPLSQADSLGRNERRESSARAGLYLRSPRSP